MRRKFAIYPALIMVLIVLVMGSFSYSPTDTSQYITFGVVKSYECEDDTIKSATDSAVIKSSFEILGSQKGCVFVLNIPKITGTGNDSILCYLGITGYDGQGNILFAKHLTGDTLSDSVATRIVLPIETPVAPADKYRLVFYGLTGSGTQAIFKNCKIQALKKFYRNN